MDLQNPSIRKFVTQPNVSYFEMDHDLIAAAGYTATIMLKSKLKTKPQNIDRDIRHDAMDLVLDVMQADLVLSKYNKMTTARHQK